MKYLLFALAITTSAFGSHCLDLSGTYRFEGFGTPGCHFRQSDKMMLSPIPLGSAIKAGAQIQIRQEGCERLEIVYRDARYSNTKDIDTSVAIELDETMVHEEGIESQKTEKGSACYFGSCLSSKDKTTWSLTQLESGDVTFKFRNQMIGLYNYILPVAERVSASCILKKI